MDGNLAMANKITEETERENNFWADVYCHIEIHACSQDEAIKKITKLYEEIPSHN